jgi:hypothetical protein
MNKQPLIATGFALGLEHLDNFEFDANCPYRACCICGAIYQTNLDRQGIAPAHALDLRNQWAENHSKRHTAAQHAQLKLSGQALTPEAAHKLAAFGLIDLTGLVTNEEIADAYATARSVPENDAEGS